MRAELAAVFVAIGSVATSGIAQSAGNPTLLQAQELTAEEDARRRTAVVQAVERAAPSVINVYVRVGEQPRADLPFAEQGEFKLEGQGSGVIIDGSGLAITNWHVVESATEESGEQKLDHRVEVTLNDGTELEASVLSTDQEHDLALIQLDLSAGHEVQAIELGDSDRLLLGETLIAIGNPYGQASSVSMGILSATGREVRLATPDGLVRRYSNLLQSDVSIHPGNSGGALIDLNGKLVGINNAGSRFISGMNYAIPVSTVRSVFRERLVSIDRLRGVYFGLATRDVEGGVEIAEVDPDSPAARAGLQPGDRLVAAGGQPILTRIDFDRLVLAATPDQELEMVIERDGDEQRVAARPLANSIYGVIRMTGIELEEVAFREQPQVLAAASIALHRENSGDPTSEPQEFMESALRVVHVRADGTGRVAGITAGDYLLGVEVVVPGTDFDTLEIHAFRTAMQVAESFSQLSRTGEKEYDCLLFRDGRVIRRPLRVLPPG